MTLHVAWGEELRARESAIRETYAGLPVEELERRRMILIAIKSRMALTLSLGAFQLVQLGISVAEEMIIAEAVKGDAVTHETLTALQFGIRLHQDVDKVLQCDSAAALAAQLEQTFSATA